MNNSEDLPDSHFFLRLLQNLWRKFRFGLNDRDPLGIKIDPSGDSESNLVGFVTTKSGGFPLLRSRERKQRNDVI